MLARAVYGLVILVSAAAAFVGLAYMTRSSLYNAYSPPEAANAAMRARALASYQNNGDFLNSTLSGSYTQNGQTLTVSVSGKQFKATNSSGPQEQFNLAAGAPLP